MPIPATTHGEVTITRVGYVEASSAAQRRVRCRLPPHGVLCWPVSQLEPSSAAQRRVRCRLPPHTACCAGMGAS
eukprot:scaffold113793_cov90-Phaeocystis_antarctica.AAC.1